MVIYNYNYNDYLQITSTVKSNLDFTGKTIETTSTHLRAGVTTTVIDAFTYDHTGRLLAQKQKINSQPEEIIVANTYDDLGQFVNKSVGGKTSQNRLQDIDYSYNVRGWLKGVNDVNAIGTDLFAFKISYDLPTSGGTALYNGNISQTFWRTANADTSLRNYNYTYDPLNRLTFATDNLGNYNENPTYDKNGNIMTLLRKGNTVLGTGSFGTIDDFVYTYSSPGNRLIKVEDNAANTEGFKNGSSTTTEYTYDDNGNMKTDLNKGITTAISYNYLNLPTDITLAGGTISYVYDANGVKQRKTVPGTVTDYANGYQYENNTLKFFPQPEGYVAHSSGIFSYIYQYKDHLGNIRLSYGDANDDGSVGTSEIIEESNYYPFGLRQFGYNTATVLGKGNSTGQKYKFQGQERQDELSLNWDSFKWRNYDYAIGRFMSIDPLAEKYTYNSPYAFAENRVIDGRELEGLEWVDADGYKVYNTNPNDGKVGYTNCATAENKNVGNALRSTDTGSKQFDKLVNMTHPVEIKVNTTDTPTKDGQVVYGVTVTPKNDNPENKSTITVFDKNITQLVEAVDANAKKGGEAFLPISNNKEVNINGITKVDMAGAVLGEEVEHSTLENINLKRSGASTPEIEKKPNAISDQILKESLKKIIMKLKTILTIISVFYFYPMFSQKGNDIIVMKKAMVDFFTSKGEINENEKLGVLTWEITDKSPLSADRKKGIYLIRTDSRSDGTDYLFFKNGDAFEIIGLGDLKTILKKTITLFEEETDETLALYVPKIMFWYNEGQRNRRNRNVKFVEKK